MAFNLSEFNPKQQEAITTIDGPVLIIAGPGTGKTKTLVGRALYMVDSCKINPENIFMATFTEKAAKEMQTRLTNDFDKAGLTINLNEMYIGTFHSICLRILTEYIEYTDLNKNIRIIDDFDQKYLVRKNIKKFMDLPNFWKAFWCKPNTSFEDKADYLTNRIISWVNRLADGLVTPDELLEYNGFYKDKVMGLGNAYKLYCDLLKEENALDFASIQAKTYYMLLNHPEILEKLQEKFKYLMIDEYQDTNGIQERLVFLLCGQKRNICVVGDDDQGLYRFRGATIKNILSFPKKFSDIEVKKIVFDINYRSNKGIVEFYNDFMLNTKGAFAWEKYRYPKNIVAKRNEPRKSPEVIRITGANTINAWCDRVYQFILKLKNSGKVTNYNQIAFLFSSVRGNSLAVPLSKYLEEKNINVYSPRSSLFFYRKEIQLLVGCLLYICNGYVSLLKKEDSREKPNNADKYELWFNEVCHLLEDVKYKDLKNTLDKIHAEIRDMQDSLDYAFTGIIYRILAHEPFSSILSKDLNGGVFHQRAVRNIAIFTQQISRFEYIQNLNVFTKNYFSYTISQFFTYYLNYLINQGVTEYEDDSEYAPSDCVSFMTIHQSKGMEFPVVVCCSLEDSPFIRKSTDYLEEKIVENFLNDSIYEPEKSIPYYDFWRKYYTAFSRAQDLLVLAAPDSPQCQSWCFSQTIDKLIEFDDKDFFDINEFDIQDIKPVNLKKMISFTSHINVYDNCPLQYKFFKELGFVAHRIGPMLYGTLVHETIEDIHKAAIRGDVHLITEDNIETWFYANYSTLTKREHMYLAPVIQRAALAQVQKYAKKRDGYWADIQEAEVGVTLVKEDYIIDGKIDLVKGDDDTVEIVDFKSEKKPDPVLNKDRIDKYRKQLQIYAYLVNKQSGRQITRMHIYYTGEDKDPNPMLTFDYDESQIEATMESFDEIAQKIISNDFSGCAKNKSMCNDCDFKHYCKK